MVHSFSSCFEEFSILNIGFLYSLSIDLGVVIYLFLLLKDGCKLETLCMLFVVFYYVFVLIPMTKVYRIPRAPTNLYFCLYKFPFYISKSRTNFKNTILKISTIASLTKIITSPLFLFLLTNKGDRNAYL